MPEVTYMGHRLIPRGIIADPEKIEAVTKMAAPQDVSQLRGFLGTVNFLIRYLPRLAAVLEPLRQHLKKEVPFIWAENQQKSFDAVKELVTSAPILRFYNTS